MNEEALEALCQFCSAKFSSEMSAESLSNLSPEKQLESFDTVLMPEESPADIKTKLVVVLINLKAKHLVKVI